MALIRSPAVILAVFTLAAVYVGTSEAYRRVGGWSEIRDVRADKEVQELGRFSVDEYNRRSSIFRRRNGGDNGGELRFVEVVEAQKQVVAGIKYYLKVTAAPAEEGGRSRRTFDSVVVVKPWLRSKKLVGFSPSKDQYVVR